MVIKFEIADDVKKKVGEIIETLNMINIDVARVVCVRSKGSKTRALARCWEFPRIWQLALDKPAHYVIEVVSERFDRISKDEKEKVLIHELLHIPRNFSGHLKSHSKGLRKTLDKRIDNLHSLFKEMEKG